MIERSRMMTEQRRWVSFQLIHRILESNKPNVIEERWWVRFHAKKSADSWPDL